MKVLMLSDLYPPIIGGGERYVESLSEELARRGHEVTVCTVSSPGLPRYEEVDGVKIYRMEGFFQKIPFLFSDPTRKWHPPTRDWLITRQLSSVLEAEKPEIVHAHGRILYSFLTLKQKKHIPLVATLHSYAFFCPRTDLMRGNSICDKPLTRDCIACGSGFYGLTKSLFSYWGTRINRGKLTLVDKFIAPSSFTKETCSRALGLGHDDILVIPNFYSVGGNGGRREKVDLPDDFILFVGALAPHKGIDVLIEAYHKLDTQTKLLLIGGTHPDHRYRSERNITVIENAPHSLVMEAMSRCRFAVLPSLCPETFGMVVIEAMSQSKAVLASRIGGLEDIVVDGETGILVNAHDTEGVAQAMDSLLRSPEVASRMGRKGMEIYLKNYTVDVVVPRIEALYQSLV